MQFTEKQLDEFIEQNRMICESYAEEFFDGDIYQSAEYLLNQI